MQTMELALGLAIAAAADAKTLKEACVSVGMLGEQFPALRAVTAPTGFEPAFNTERNALLNKVDALDHQQCAESSRADARTIRDGLDLIRKQFVELKQIGTKP
jgi:hypothetical protein